MEIKFEKYQGAGNDFVMIDNRTLFFPKENTDLIAAMCDRRFGVGADGLILLESAEGYDFRMVYYNADGNESTMCGNGGRCIVAFAKALEVMDVKTHFIAIDGPHKGECLPNGEIRIGMKDVTSIETIAKGHYFLDTGSPHYVLVEDVMPEEIVERAKSIRYNTRFKEEGVNVNFVVINKDEVQIRTYERGVEDETLACGTGSVAAAMVANLYTNRKEYKVKTQGGNLAVGFAEALKNVFLVGPAIKVFSGVYRKN